MPKKNRLPPECRDFITPDPTEPRIVVEKGTGAIGFILPDREIWIPVSAVFDALVAKESGVVKLKELVDSRGLYCVVGK